MKLGLSMFLVSMHKTLALCNGTNDLPKHMESQRCCQEEPALPANICGRYLLNLGGLSYL